VSVTHVKQITNLSDFPITVKNDENPSSLPGGALHIPANQGPINVDISIPWCNWDGDFTAHRVSIAFSISILNFGGARNYLIWQANQSDGDHVRVCTDGIYYYTGHFGHAIDAVGGDRKIKVTGSGSTGVTSIDIQRA
jgi:hypothetical protein